MLAACSGGKKSSQLSLPGKFYHNTTARYNGFYYGKLKLNRLKQSMTSALQDDYTKLLPLFTDEEAGNGAKGDLDSVIIKLSVVTQLHPKSKWVDDCNFLIGQSYFYKKNYDDALSTFQYIVASYKETAKKKKKGGKKIKEGDVTIPWLKQNDGFSIKHKPVRDEALLWLLKSYIALEKYNEAQSIIKVLAADHTFPFQLRDEFTLLNCQLFLKQNKYAEAIAPLKLAIVLTKKKKDKTRYAYILSQLYQLTNNSDKAIESFKKVLAMKPEYKMAFYANINIAKSFSGSGKTSAAEIISLLEKLARDDKYDEFRDQIYYTMAEVYLKENNKTSAVKALNKSIETSTVNTNQKALSFLKLGELDFKEKKYVTAAGFYDSTAAFMSKTFEKFEQVNKLKTTLDNLVFQINIISREDSLQKLASLSEKELNKVLDAIIDDFEKQQKLDSLSSNTIVNATEKKPEEITDSKNGWYFYNAATKGSGFNDFKKKWSSRVNEDNWRRSNKTSAEENALNQNSNSGETGTVFSGSKISRKDLMKDIPFKAEQKNTSDKKIQQALYTLGGIYKENLKDEEYAIKTFEELVARYQRFELEPATFYSLYLLYMNKNMAMQIENYTKQLLINYPNYEFAKLLNNPNYTSEKAKVANQVEIYYQSTYSLFGQQKYNEVIVNSQVADTLFIPNPLAAKFDLLASFAIAKLQPVDTFKVALKNIIKKYAAGEEVEKAKQLLAGIEKPKVIDRNPKSQIDSTQASNTNSVYTLHKTNAHFFIVLFADDDPAIEDMKDSLQNFVTKNYALNNYKVSTMMLDKKQQMILVKQMKNQDEAMNFYSDASSQTFYDEIEMTDFYFFAIDDKNFAAFFKNKNITDYMEFFNENYNP